MADKLTATVRGDARGLAQEVTIRGHRLAADESPSVGGTDTGPNAHEWLLGALGACTSMTVAMYARRKGWPLMHVSVTLTHEAVKGSPRADKIERAITLEGELDAEQRERLLEIANKCPIHRALTAGVDVETRLER